MIFRPLFIGVFLFCNIAYSQGQNVKFEHLNARNGLSHNSILCINQDSRGFMWFGTYGGLNKYDGYKFTNYKTEYGDKHSLHTNPIVHIFEDNEGLIWLGTYGGGVISYNPKSDVFTEFKDLHLDATNKIRMNVRSTYQDEEGFLWFATSEGLDRYDKKKNEFTNYKIKSDVHADNNVITIYVGPSGKWWLGTYMGLKLFDKKTGMFQSYKPDPLNDNSLSNPNVLAVYEDKDGIVWMGTEGGGLNRLDPTTGSITYFKNDPQNKNSLNNNIVYSIEEIEPGKLWIGTEGGVNIFNIRTGDFEFIINDPRNNTSLSNNTVRSLFKDKGGVIWIGTDGGGINKSDSQRKKFDLYQSDIENKFSLSNNSVFAIEEDSFGNIWMGTAGGGLNKFDPKSKKFISFMPDPKDPNSISAPKILSLSIGPSKNIWIGTDRGGLCMLPAKSLNRAKPDFLKYYSSPKPNSLKSNVIYSVLEDHTGVVWAGTWSRGIHKMVFDKVLSNGELDYQNPTITNYRNDPKDSASIAQDIAFSMYEDKQGTLWIGTAGNGLDKRMVIKKEIDGKVKEQDVFIHYVSDPDDPTSLSNNNVSAMHESKAGEFWIGTSIGLNKMDREKGTFKVYSTKDGLPNNVIFGILEDNSGNLWLSTLGGLSKFNPKTETFKNYTYEDGLQDNMFNAHAYYSSSTNKMYFGGPYGVNVFSPDSIQDNPYKPQVMITDFKIFNKSVIIGKNNGGIEHLPSSISTTSDIYLSHKDYVFSLEFSSSSYAIPSKNRFSYKMDGFDEGWVNTDAGNRIATYTNLNPGEYTFRVKATNCDGVWSETETAIKIHIAPPFWQTIWFKTLALLSVSGLVFSIFRVRVNNIEKQKKDLEKQVTLRTKEILAQKEEIESQKENIEEKNMILEKQYYEIEEARRMIKEKNEQLREYNATLENSVIERTEQLRKTFDNLAETNKELDQFVYRSAHDLKGPLASITGLCYLGSMETRDPKILELLKRMENTTAEMTTKLVRLMKIHEFNTIELHIAPVNYQDIFEEIWNDISTKYACNDINIRLNIEKSNDYRSDPELLRKLLKNLIENSVKYKDEHKANRYINIAVKSTNGLTEISIADNGIGIPQNQADRVFDLFVTASENIKGFGLGLYEAKLIARRLNGHIRLKYPENGDTEFVITL
jgi:ligand-binding sensor domain-containing protein/signal transduction histidine kinase